MRHLQVAVEELRRLRDARVGADRQNPGMYAIYWYDKHGQEIRSAGGFGDVDEAAEAIDFLVVETVVDAYRDMEADSD
jgi:hypothetical protein